MKSWDEIDFENRNKSVLRQPFSEEDLKRMAFDPVRDDPKKIFEAGRAMMKSIVRNKHVVRVEEESR